ncbi:MAG: LysM peptidoglycan-binding domain-containing protein [Firmicutes bacterium]|nr:LysM peptidoglycan-binding domain-containing protein [Bacillota bacterium]
MEQRVGSTAFRFVAGALFTLALLASGYLLGVTRFSPPPEPEPALAELAELEQLVAAVQSMGSSISDLTAQVAQLHVSFADLQARVAQQGTAVESLGDTVLSFSSDISAQAESALAQLQALAVDPEASELDALLQTVQSMDHSLARLAEQVAQLQDGLAGLETQSTAQGLEVEALAAALRTLSAQVAEQAAATSTQLQSLAGMWEGVDLNAVLASLQAMDQSAAGLSDQLAEIQAALTSVQDQGAEQDLAIQRLAEALRALSDQVAEHAETTAEKLEALAEAIEGQAVAALAAAPYAEESTADALADEPEEIVPEPPAQVAAVAVLAEVVSPAESAEPDTYAASAQDLAQAEVQVTEDSMAPVPVRFEQPPKQLALVLKIKRHDTIWAIANRFQAPPSQTFINDIIDLNDVDPYRLRIGQDLLVPLRDDVFKIVEVE